jgi:hypothetical protein
MGTVQICEQKQFHLDLRPKFRRFLTKIEQTAMNAAYVLSVDSSEHREMLFCEIKASQADDFA